MIRVIFFLVMFLHFSSIDVLGQTTRTFYAVEDNIIFEPVMNDETERSNGIGNHIYVGVAKSNGIRRGLIKFDLENLNIPNGQEILSAKLVLTANLKGNSQPYIYEIHRLMKFWTEGDSDADGPTFGNGGNGVDSEPEDCSWIRNYVDDPNNPNDPGDLFWDNEGGDFINEITASATIQMRDEHEVEFEDAKLISDINFMIDNPFQNFGWIILQQDDEILSTSSNEIPYGVRFYSKEAPAFSMDDNVTIQQTPKLIITYGETGLSLEAKDFTTQILSNNTITLNWTTSNNTPLHQFLLEKSKDGKHFNHLATIQQQESNNYQFIDNQPFNGVNYYKLKVINEDGLIVSSQVNSIDFEVPFDAKIIKNGRSSELQLEITTHQSHSVQLLINDSSGKVVYQESLILIKGQNSIVLPLTKIGAGNYFITIKSSEWTKNLQWIKW